MYLQKAEDSLKASQILLDNGLYDDMVARSYYAAFRLACVALHNAGQLDIENVKGRSHKWVKIHLKAHLVFLYNARDHADYNPNYSHSREEAEEVLSKLIEFFQTIKGYLNT
jgi:uncharacterized protein (UPF0332 family)